MLSPAHADAAHAVQFLQLARQATMLASREALGHWLADDVQRMLPHQAILAASGDFRRGDLRVEVVAVRAAARERGLGVESGTRLAALAHALRDGWVAAQHAPCRVNLGDIPTPSSLCGLRGALVHGARELAPASERILALLDEGAAFSDQAAQAFGLLLPFIDAALRRLPAVSPAVCEGIPGGGIHALGGARGFAPARLPLSERERQIMTWVAMGKTNPEIGCILHISEFTVKNHLKSIFTKLDVTNRAQAVAKLTGLSVHA